MSIKVPAALAAAGLLCLALPATPAAAQTQTCTSGDPTTIKINGDNAFCGTASATNTYVYAYLGMPYALPPTGALRWQPPKTVSMPPANFPKYASYANVCPQNFTVSPAPASGEDCLYLNVWAPANAINTQKKLPVMVFIHGGAFEEGGSSIPYTKPSGGGPGLAVFDGGRLADFAKAQDVIVVTLNYRLGALGFLTAATSGTAPTLNGNYGLLDQVQALQWVNKNIGLFGGDNTKVTLFGESAGAMSVGLHTLASDKSAGYFQYAVMESNPMGIAYQTTAQAQAGSGTTFLTALCKVMTGGTACQNSTGWWMNATTAQILEAQGPVSSTVATAYRSGADIMTAGLRAGISANPNLPWAPVIDTASGLNNVLGQPVQGYTNVNLQRKPMFFGVNANEGVLFIAKYFHEASWAFTTAEYEKFLTENFTAAGEAAIIAQDRYNPAKIAPGTLYNSVALAFSRVITDYSFVCANIWSANQQYHVTPTETALFGYQFTQPPFFDFYNLSGQNADYNACEPTTAMVCHGNELPYVFNNLAAVSPPYTSYMPTGSDQPLASQMTLAWLAFAGSTNGEPAGWMKYVPGGDVGIFGSGPSMPNLATGAYCSMWNTYAPYPTNGSGK
ncbi:MAG TPA: carboxylesterase family protein [Rhizomicrobium sp.]|nr:carboxylesterase family protein [Rhizomicrobium sp.]